MPSSQWHQLNEIVELIMLTDPASVLDIGIGFGKYGVLAREYLDIHGGHGEYNAKRHRIDGIEIFGDYVTPVHRFIYDNVYVGDAVDVLPSLPSYGLILLIDVLEHLDRPRAGRLLRLCRDKGENVLISTPLDIGDQGSIYHNEYETHTSQWRRPDFDMFERRFFIRNEASLICYAGRRAPQVAAMFERNQVRSALKTLVPVVRAPYRLVRRLRRKFATRRTRLDAIEGHKGE